MEQLRDHGRTVNELRAVKINNHYLMHPAGSVLIEMGNTKVICTATVEEKTAKHLKGTGQGWVSAEYSMLPGSTQTRKQRDSSKGKIDGRSQEIQRLIGRSLRSVVDMEKLGERTIWLDCDVIQADGGTRTASITGAFIAMVEAMKTLKEQGALEEIPVRSMVSAVSVGIIDGKVMLDLCYSEDSRAQVDMNVVMTDQGEFIEVQGTGEEAPFTAVQLQELIAAATKGCSDLHQVQKEVLGEINL
ncbi:ribonuclease PH [Anaerovorax sp. IOR16]|uniref:ribonuclease PH n=1 Tax=Anaerovorax sp. IOR16 TaxID=2773458 RepID=UPI0019D1C1A6|nr:ribonuclease PH [Anaerovorax sp. IOR16]